MPIRSGPNSPERPSRKVVGQRSDPSRGPASFTGSQEAAPPLGSSEPERCETRRSGCSVGELPCACQSSPRTVGCAPVAVRPSDPLRDQRARTCSYREGRRSAIGTVPLSSRRFDDEPRPDHVLAMSMNGTSESGFWSESLLMAWSGSVPDKIFLIGTSHFLPLSVRGTASIT